MIGQRKAVQFKYPIERVTEKLANWKSATLSQAGRDIMIKSVVQAISVVYYFIRQFVTSFGNFVLVSSCLQMWMNIKQNGALGTTCALGLSYKIINEMRLISNKINIMKNIMRGL